MIIPAEPAGVSAVSAMVQEIAVIAFGCRHGPMWTGAREKFKRKVFHLAGFDPRGARFYHQMYREQAEPNRSAARRSAREQAEADVRRCWGVTDGWKGDPLKGCNVFLPAQEHDSVCGKGWISDGPQLGEIGEKRSQ